MSGLIALDPLLVAAAPAVAALAIAVGGGRAARVAPALAATGPLVTIVYALVAVARIGSGDGSPAPAPFIGRLASPLVERVWLGDGHRWALHIGGAVDGLAAVMLLVVGGVALCVVLFSAGYMSDDPGRPRYFAVLSLFVASMNLLVVAASFTTLFVAWELVGACSYLLIGFWFERPAAAEAARKAFITTRVADVGMLLAAAIAWRSAETDSFSAILSEAADLAPTAAAGIALSLAVAAFGKSAQVPFHAWLPDAMEGPTPVSALIHAATMVAAGVYAIARVWPLFEMAGQARSVVLLAGTVSALGAAVAACRQRDIKKVLAYSTISQLGFMFAALGAGAWRAAFFHLVTHAAFKSLLFLSAGSVIHATGTQDLHALGGLGKRMPVTFGAWAAGALALAGIPPLSGFVSKDAVLEAVISTNTVAGGALFVASGLTAFYIARATRLAFLGAPRAEVTHGSPVSMTAPLVALGVATVVMGLARTPVLGLVGAHAEPFSLAVSVAAIAIALLGGLAGWYDGADPARDVSLGERMGVLDGAAAAGFWYDALVDRAVVRPVGWSARALWAVGDRLLVDGAVAVVATGARAAARAMSRLHRGQVQGQATVAVVWGAIVLALIAWMGR